MGDSDEDEGDEEYVQAEEDEEDGEEEAEEDVEEDDVADESAPASKKFRKGNLVLPEGVFDDLVYIVVKASSKPGNTVEIKLARVLDQLRVFTQEEPYVIDEEIYLIDVEWANDAKEAYTAALASAKKAKKASKQPKQPK